MCGATSKNALVGLKPATDVAAAELESRIQQHLFEHPMASATHVQMQTLQPTLTSTMDQKGENNERKNSLSE